MHVSKKKLIGGILGVLLLIPIGVYIVNAFARQVPPEEKFYSLDEQEYVPDELIVQFTKGYEPDYVEKQLRQREVLQDSAFGQIVIAKDRTRDTLQALPPLERRQAEVEQMFAELGVIGYTPTVSQGDGELGQFYTLQFPQGTDLEQKQQELSQYQAIQFIEPNNIVQLFQSQAPNDPDYSQQWGLQKVEALDAWQSTKGSKSVTVAVIDTGVDTSHPDLSANIISGRNMYTGTSNVSDDNGHGSHVAGVIGAVTNNGRGVAGVNWNVNILPVRVCNASGECNLQAIADGLTYAVNSGAKVANMSLGTVKPCTQSALIRTAVQNAVGNNVIIVAAAGNANSKTNTPAQSSNNTSPASCSGVISVGAIGPNNSRPSYSFWDSAIAAPGGSGTTPSTGVLSTWMQGQYNAIAGTSMAAPHVAGAAALLLSIDPNLTPSQIRKCLTDGATPISTDRPLGPLLNIPGAIEACNLQNQPTQIPSDAPTPTTSPRGDTDTGYAIGGIVFEDINRNKEEDPGERRIQGVSLVLDQNGNKSDTTNTKGEFYFPNLQEGSFTLNLSMGPSSIWELTNKLTPQNKTLYYKIPIFNVPTDTTISPSPGSDEPSTTPGGGNGGSGDNENGGNGGDGSNEDSQNESNSTPTPSPTPLFFYDCQPVQGTRTVNGEQISFSYLECSQSSRYFQP